MYDIFFVSYEEPNAESNWLDLKRKMPHARRIHGITGIGNAHKECARQSYTKMFWTVDGDTLVDDDFLFDYVPPEWDQDYLHLYYSRNPMIGLSYGYGAVKLWPRKRVLEYKGSWLDFTTSVGNIKIVDQVIAATYFNMSPFEAWKSAFRETVKLLVNLNKDPTDSMSAERLKAWAFPRRDEDFYEWCEIGCNDARTWYQTNKDNLSLVNDFTWLRGMFNAKYQSRWHA